LRSDIAMRPGKADLLEAIHRSESNVTAALKAAAILRLKRA